MVDTPRSRRIAARIQDLVAQNLESTVKNPDLGFVTITDVRVTGDLQHATVFYTVMGDETQQATTADLLEGAKGRLRSLVGKGLGIRLTPSLEFIHDALPETASHLEELLAEAKRHDAEVAALAAAGRYAGDEDPYRKPVGEDDEGEAPAQDVDVDAAPAQDVDVDEAPAQDDAVRDR